jgi:prostamide/prostaglandin F2alpha synthase
LDRAREEFESAGVRLVLIGQATPRHAAHFRRTQKLELPVLADERRASYKAAGAKMGGVGELLGPKVMAKGVSTLLSTGKMQTRTVGNPAQLGGAAVIAPGDRVLWSKMARDASDNASAETILAAARTAPARP